MSTSGTILTFDPPGTTPTVERGAVSGSSMFAGGGASVVVDSRSVGGRQARSEDREAILSSLYEERRKLNRAKRVNSLSSSEQDYLAELERYIDQWEEPDQDARADIWTRFEDAARSMLLLQAAVERAKK